jgi:nucleoside 2-deoxyribosyltransferase
MTKTEFIIAELHEADSHLRNAMRAAGDLIARGKPSYRLVTDNIRESEWYLDDACAYAENMMPKKKLRKGLTTSKRRGKMAAQ